MEPDVVTAVAVYLPLEGVPSVLSVCSSWNNAVCHNELWAKVLQRQWLLTTTGVFGVKFPGGCRQICQSICTLDQQKYHQPIELGHMSEPAKRFLFGIATGFIPTADGVFTYHCKGSMAIHFRHTPGAEVPEYNESSSLRLGGSWMWSPDRESWFPTKTLQITQGRLGSGSIVLESDNMQIVHFLEEWPIAPLVATEISLLRDSALANHKQLHAGTIRDFIRAVGTGPQPTTSCLATNMFTIHFHLLPALHLKCTEQKWEISESTKGKVSCGRVQAFEDLLSQLNRKRAGTDFVGVDGRPLPPLSSYIAQYECFYRRVQLGLPESD